MADPVAANPGPRPNLAAKITAIADRLTGARQLAQAAQVREAVARSEITQGITEAMIGRAAARAQLREIAARCYFVPRAPLHDRRNDPPASRLQRWRTRHPQHMVARSGVWWPSGDATRDLAAITVYVARGADPSLAPASPLDQAWYLQTYADVAAENTAPLLHYLRSGWREGRVPHRLFDLGHYARVTNGEAEMLQISPLEHYVRAGAPQGLSPHPLFDPMHYASQGPQLQGGEDMLWHYLRDGWRQGLSPHPLFDPAWYAGQMAAPPAEAPLLHYLVHGWRDGLSPHALFEPAWYLAQNADVAAGGAEPLQHFLSSGAAEGRSPSPWFDLPYYVAARGGRAAAGVNPLVDYLQGGAWTVAESRPGFPNAAYIAAQPGLAREGLTPLEHWARTHRR